MKKTDKYTIISNEPIFNPDLTNKAKGLLTTLLALPDDWNININGLTKLSNDSRDGIMSQLKELEKAGYVTKKQTRNEKGQLASTKYTIYESRNLNPCYTNCKDEKANNTDGCNTKRNINETNNTESNNTNSNIIESENTHDKINNPKNGLNTDFSPQSEKPTTAKSTTKKPQSEKPTTVKLDTKKPQSEKPYTEKPYTGKPYTEKPTLSNTNISNTNISNTNLSSTNLSINQIDEIDLSNQYYRSLVAEQISYDAIMEQLEYQEKNPDEPKIVSCSKEFYETAYELICEVMQNTNKTITIGGVNLNAERVKQVFLQNNEETIAYVYSCVMKRSKTEPIKNIKAYLLTALYHAPITMNVQIESELAQHGYGY